MSKENKTFQTYILWLIDIVCIIVAFMIASWLRYNVFGDKDYGDKTIHYLMCLVFLLFGVVYFFLADWNRDFIIRGYAKELFSVIHFMSFMVFLAIVVIFFIKWYKFLSRPFVVLFVFIDILMTYFARIAFKKFFREYISSDSNAVRVVVVAEKDLMESTIKKLTKGGTKLGYKIVRAYAADVSSKDDLAAYIRKDSGSEPGASTEWYIEGVHIHAGIDNLTARLITDPFDEVFINTPNISQNKMQDIILGFEEMGITTHYTLELPNISKAGTQFDDFLDYSVITYSMNRSSYKRLFIKRFLDILGGLIGVIITGIITLFLAPAIKLDSPGPIFFSQTRIGKNGRRFKIYKFRSMYIDAEERKKELEANNEMDGLMFKMDHDPRITKVGAFIRKTSLDEWPQFLNVLKGDMSLVGTRPPTEDEFARYNEHYRRRLSMTPGITGLWQVSGRSEIKNFDDVVKLDLEYIDNWSLTEDIKILFRTFGVMFTGRGAK